MMKSQKTHLNELTATLFLCCSTIALIACDAESNSDLTNPLINSETLDQNSNGSIASDASTIQDDSTSADSTDNSVAGEIDTDGSGTRSDDEAIQSDSGSDMQSLMQGYVDIDIDGENASGLFTVSDVPVSVRAAIPNAFIPLQDECVSYRRSGRSPQEPDFQSTTISAGEVITITGPGGTLGELQRTDNFGNLSYQIPFNGMLSTTVPDGTVVDIPGDRFPGFNDVMLPVISTFDVDATTGAMLTPQTGFSWTPNTTGSQTYIRLLGEVFTYTDINDPATYETVGVTCHLLDDGSYRFPAALQAELGANFVASPYYIARKGVRFQRHGDALLAVVSSSEQEGTPF